MYGVELEHRPDNPHDSNAIAVIGIAERRGLFKRSVGRWHIGYLHRGLAAEIISDLVSKGVLGHHYIAPTYRSAELPFVYVASQPMVLTAVAGNVLSLGAVSTGGIFNVACGLSGVKQKFQ